MDVVLDGLAVGESPRWIDGRLWFCHWGTGEVVAVAPGGASEVTVRLPAATLPFCLDRLPDGRLLLVDGPAGRVLRRAPDGALAVHAELAGLSPHAWNEIVVDARGNAYVNGIGFDMRTGTDGAPGRLALVTPAGEVRQVADGLAFPNGMALTPDGATLLVAESWGRRISAFDVAEDGSLGGRRAWAEVDGAPDGICLDAEGAAWYADVPNRRCMRVREGGAVLDTVALDRGAFACMLGGEDGRTLFVLAAEWRGPAAMTGGARTGRLLAVRAPAPRAGRP
jgi:sugar lactone lactonase YvrE